MHPPTQYAKSGEDLYVAFQVVGDGPFDLIFAPSYASHVEANWEWPPFARFLEQLASFSRLILFDRRGTGMSDRFSGAPNFEEMLDDVRAVMDAAGSERAALLGANEGGALCALFAATYPERTLGLVLYASLARGTWAPDHPWAPTRERHEHILRTYRERYGREAVFAGLLAPSLAGDEAYRQAVARGQRYGVSPGAAIAWWRMLMDIDIRNVLPTIRVPTLVLHRSGDRAAPPEGSRYMAKRIPGAKYVELAGSENLPFVGDTEGLLSEIEEFLTGSRRVTAPDRVLATVLFTDIVGSTERAAELGDRRWRELLDEHDQLVRREIERHRGREVNTVGDGFLATFDGPARAIRCAAEIRDAVRRLGMDVRAGLHTGECEVRGEDVGGIAVHIGARVAALAGAGEVLVSSTVKDLVVGSGIEFADRGAHALKGVPGEWRLYLVDMGSRR